VMLWLYVCRKNCLFCVLMSARDGERLGVSGGASVSAMLFLGACACARQCCLVRLICFCILPRTLSGAPFLLPVTCSVLITFSSTNAPYQQVIHAEGYSMPTTVYLGAQ
jgi:hypothetical protein